MENIYAEGLYFNPNKPDLSEAVKKWKKGSISINIQRFIAQLETLRGYADDKGYIKFDLTKNARKDNPEETFYSFKLNTWKPEAKNMPDSEVVDKEFDELR